MMVQCIIEKQNRLGVIGNQCREPLDTVFGIHRSSSEDKMNGKFAGSRTETRVSVMNDGIDIVMFCSNFVHAAAATCNMYSTAEQTN